MHGALRFVSEPDSGPYDAMNKGIRFAGGEVIGILNADDRYTDGKVVTDVLAAMNDAGAGACYGDLVFVNPAGRVTRYWKAGIYKRNRFLNGWMPPHPTFFVRRDVYERFGVFRTDIGSAADYELMLRFLFLHEVRCAYVPRVIVRMRLGGISTATVAGRLRAHAGDRTAWKVNGLTPRPWTIPLKPLRKLPQWFVRRPAAGGHGTQ
jgi:glycosyltransferase